MIENAWKKVTKRTLTSACKKLWSETVDECDTEETETVSTLWVKPIVNEVASLAKIKELEVDSNAIDELVGSIVFCIVLLSGAYSQRGCIFGQN
ncbi:hypothetical protein AVEN_132065-1 [Araneus ventricosus]|uniref:DDE-1 domain-containing protein n=1 Tax=Araneus ventricosus TaxID=182803 RepID=A0A4Y2EER6_ARAVE|nr:hypothetical protein AVEN_132065-1 [Araneus ventricosus]